MREECCRLSRLKEGHVVDPSLEQYPGLEENFDLMMMNHCSSYMYLHLLFPFLLLLLLLLFPLLHLESSIHRPPLVSMWGCRPWLTQREESCGRSSISGQPPELPLAYHILIIIIYLYIFLVKRNIFLVKIFLFVSCEKNLNK